MKWILFFFSAFIFLGCQEKSKSSMLGSDYRLFRDTPAWDLAQAVEDDDVDEIKAIVSKRKDLLGFREERFGYTVLTMAIMHWQIISCRALLELGANPNEHDHYNGSTPLIRAADIPSDKEVGLELIELLLKYGADPNIEETGDRPEGNTTRQTPLLKACADVSISPIKKVKKLVEAGANVNYTNEFAASPLRMALVMEHYDVILYLLEKGANYDKSVGVFSGKKCFLWEALRYDMPDLDSEKYKQKMLVVAFLKEKGIDYRGTPIPESMVKKAKKRFPETWKEYLKVY